MHRKQFTLLAAAAAILLISGSAMATPSAGTVRPAVAAWAPSAEPADRRLCEEETPPPPAPFPCRCPSTTCVLCRSVGEVDFQALTRQFGTASPAAEARPPFADPVETSLHYPCRCPNPSCYLCRSVADVGIEGIDVLPHQ